MNLINAHWLVKAWIGTALLHPFAVLPVVLTAIDNRGIAWRRFKVVRHGVIFEGQQLALPVEDFKLVISAVRYPGNEYLPDATGRMQTHDVPPAVPIIKFTDDTDTRCVGCPYREASPAYIQQTGWLRTEFFEDLLVRAFCQQIQIEITQR